MRLHNDLLQLRSCNHFVKSQSAYYLSLNEFTNHGFNRIINTWSANIIWAQGNIFTNQTSRLLSLKSNNRKHNETTTLVIMVKFNSFWVFLVYVGARIWFVCDSHNLISNQQMWRLGRGWWSNPTYKKKSPMQKLIPTITWSNLGI